MNSGLEDNKNEKTVNERIQMGKIFKGSIKLPVFHLKLNNPENILWFTLNLEKELSFNLLK